MAVEKRLRPNPPPTPPATMEICAKSLLMTRRARAPSPGRMASGPAVQRSNKDAPELLVVRSIARKRTANDQGVREGRYLLRTKSGTENVPRAQLWHLLHGQLRRSRRGVSGISKGDLAIRSGLPSGTGKSGIEAHIFIAFRHMHGRSRSSAAFMLWRALGLTPRSALDKFDKAPSKMSPMSSLHEPPRWARDPAHPHTHPEPEAAARRSTGLKAFAYTTRSPPGPDHQPPAVTWPARRSKNLLKT